MTTTPSLRTGVALFSRADWVAVVIAFVAHAAVALVLVSVREQRSPRPSEPIEVEIVTQKAVEPIAARQPPPAAAPLPMATHTPVKIDKPKTIATVTPKEEVVPDSEQAVEEPHNITTPSTSSSSAVDGGASGGTANGVAGGVAGGVKGGSADGRPGGDALTGPTYGADYLHNEPPRYPAVARKLHLEGTTMLRVTVGADGHPTNVRVHASAGDDTLDDAAKEAVQHWTFVPARQGGKPIAAEVNVPVQFKLEAANQE